MIAVVIPYYKIAFFESTLISLKNQTDKRFKVYIGNDASPDDPKPLIERYENSFPLTYTEFKSNLGGKSLIKQWERCIDQISDEKWIMILGDDDTLSENCIETFYKNLKTIENQQINVVRFATKIINEKNESVSDVFRHPQMESSVDFLFRKLNGGTRSSLSEYVFSTHNVQQNKFKELPLAWHSDTLGVLEFSEFGTVFTINDAIVNFRWSGQNITSKREDMVIKNSATFDFYYYLLNAHKKHFNATQQETLYNRLERSFLDDKKNSYFCVKLIKIYFRNSKFRSFFSLLHKAISQGYKKQTSL
ncbi:MAG: glycosyltransferase family 2 protein [Flavobacterium sp. JAD_PAG50586_2]|nr:MAG: glycosyltransferase family 2 protein [Flavobacterium sp. JAD_PAG50586_2]